MRQFVRGTRSVVRTFLFRVTFWLRWWTILSLIIKLLASVSSSLLNRSVETMARRTAELLAKNWLTTWALYVSSDVSWRYTCGNEMWRIELLGTAQADSRWLLIGNLRNPTIFTNCNNWLRLCTQNRVANWQTKTQTHPWCDEKKRILFRKFSNQTKFEVFRIGWISRNSARYGIHVIVPLPDGIASPHTDPLRNRAILFQLLRQFPFNSKCLVSSLNKCDNSLLIWNIS